MTIPGLVGKPLVEQLPELFQEVKPARFAPKITGRSGRYKTALRPRLGFRVGEVVKEALDVYAMLCEEV